MVWIIIENLNKKLNRVLRRTDLVPGLNSRLFGREKGFYGGRWFNYCEFDSQIHMITVKGTL